MQGTDVNLSIECDLELNISQPKIESYIGDGVRSNAKRELEKVTSI